MRGSESDPFEMLIEFLIYKTNIYVIQFNDRGKKKNP